MVPLYPIEVIGLLSRVKIDAAVDTCFEGEVCLPATVAIELGLVLMGREEFEYADGRREMDYLFAVSRFFCGVGCFLQGKLSSWENRSPSASFLP